MASVLVIVLIVVVSVAMYVVIGSQGGFVGVPRLLPPSFASGTTGSTLSTVLYGLLMAALLVALGLIVYRIRGLRD